MLNDVNPMQFEHDWFAAQTRQVRSRVSYGVRILEPSLTQDRQIASYR